MTELEETHPDVYHTFVNLGYHAVRRSDRFWSGLWSDFVIELKTSGGLTRGRGMTDSTRNQWVSTSHEFANIHDKMTQFTKTHISTSEQHVYLSPARVSRDTADCLKVYNWFHEHNPFTQSDERLKSLSMGVIGDGLNCLQAEQIGREIHKKLDNVPQAEAKI